jgi:hypothetical protein
VIGGRGAQVAHPLLDELRRHRALLQHLLEGLGLDEAAGDAGSDAARRLAASRWRRQKG